MSYGYWLKDEDLENPETLFKVIQGEITCGTLVSFDNFQLESVSIDPVEVKNKLGKPKRITIDKYVEDKEGYFVLLNIERDENGWMATGDCAQRVFANTCDRDNYCEKLKQLLLSKGFDTSITENKKFSSF